MSEAYVEQPVAGAALLLWAADEGARVLTPLHLALSLRALELPCELYFTAATVRWLARDADATVQHRLEALAQAGATLYACSDALAAQGLRLDALHGACAGHGGLLQFGLRAADARWRCLVF